MHRLWHALRMRALMWPANSNATSNPNLLSQSHSRTLSAAAKHQNHQHLGRRLQLMQMHSLQDLPHCLLLQLLPVRRGDCESSSPRARGSGMQICGGGR